MNTTIDGTEGDLTEDDLIYPFDDLDYADNEDDDAVRGPYDEGPDEDGNDW